MPEWLTTIESVIIRNSMLAIIYRVCNNCVPEWPAAV